MPKKRATRKTTVSPPAETFPVVVDGQSIQVPRSMPDPLSGQPVPTTMIQACRLAGVEVPHYCYHPKLPVAGNCRICLVEYGLPVLGPDRQPLLNADGTVQMRKSPRPAIACATPIAPGMEIFTDTPSVRKMRESVMAFLLANHPLDCPICDQAGECKLQQYALDYGAASSRFVETKVHKPKAVDLGPRLVLDDERCILCSRCIRFTRDIVGDDALGIIQRGSHSVLTHYPGRPFDNNYTLNTADICPVGALTSKDFRFKMRVWFLKQTPSLCTSCGTGCNVLIGSRDNRIYRYVPRQNDAVNSCWMCDTGRLNYKWIGRPDRLDSVKIKNQSGSLQDSRWDDALAEVIQRLQNASPGQVALVASARLSNEELFLLGKIARKTGALTDAVPRPIKADKLLVCADQNPNSTGARLAGLVPPKMGSNLRKIAQAIRAGTVRILLVFGEDVTKHGLEAELLSQLECLIVSDILPGATALRAHCLLPGAAHAEKQGSFTNIHGRVQKFMKAVEPPGDARPEWEFLLACVEQIVEPLGVRTIDGLFNLMAGEIPAFRGMTWAGLGDEGASAAI